MRLEPVAPDHMTDEQRRLHDEMAPEVEAKLRGFVSSRDDGALIGPFPPMIAFPAWGAGQWAATKALLDHTVLPKPAHEIAILVTGAHFRVGYELYAHERVAAATDLDEATIATLVAGQRPDGLDAQGAAAHDLAAALVRGGPVPDATYAAAASAFGEEGAAELVFLVAGYCSVSMLLNGFATPTPDGAL